jgi:hypothetical protein
MNFKSVTINLLLTTLSGGVLLQTLEAQAALITFGAWNPDPFTVTTNPQGTRFATGNATASPFTLKAFAQATYTDVREPPPPYSARTRITLSNFFTVTPETGEKNGDKVKGFLSASLRGLYQSSGVEGGDVDFFNYGSVLGRVNVGGLGSWESHSYPTYFVSGSSGTIPYEQDFDDVLQGILTIGEQYHLNMSLEVFAETSRGTSRAFSNFGGDNGGLRVDIRAEPVPEPLTILGSATGLGFAAFFKRKHSKKLKKS